jgi:hypothetical protein
MFTDYWVIAQLWAQGCALMLLLYASFFAVHSLRFWAGESDSALQTSLERQNYLMSVIMQVGLWFQALSLLMFLHTVNEHLPPLIKGAMCATGTLGINDWGYPLLGLKSLAILVYAMYLFINYLDNQEPAYPLTPHKYWWLFPALLLAVLDLYVLVQYFANIKPDLIATCCSVDFSAMNRTPYSIGQENYYRQVAWWLWVLSACLLFAGWVGKVWKWHLLLACLGAVFSVVYVASAIYVLKYHFVKYIYGLPSHLCLFDIFWAKYYAIGYILFGAYYTLLLSFLGYIVILSQQKKLTHYPIFLEKRLRNMLFWGLLISFVTPILYEWWSGYDF